MDAKYWNAAENVRRLQKFEEAAKETRFLDTSLRTKMDDLSMNSEASKSIDESPPPTPTDLNRPFIPDRYPVVSCADPSSGYVSWLLPSDGDCGYIGRRKHGARGPRICISNIYVSRDHAKIQRENGCFYLLDCGLEFGTLVNDVLVTERVKLKNHDVIGIAVLCEKQTRQAQLVSDQHFVHTALKFLNFVVAHRFRVKMQLGVLLVIGLPHVPVSNGPGSITRTFEKHDIIRDSI